MRQGNIERNIYETSHRITAASGQKKQVSLITMLLNTYMCQATMHVFRFCMNNLWNYGIGFIKSEKKSKSI